MKQTIRRKINFTRHNLISCQNVSIYRVLFEYVCWVLAGKPDDYK